MTWFRLRGDARLGHCDSDNCGGQPMWRLEAGGIGSNYCSGCRQKIDPSRCTCQFVKDDYGAPQIKVCEACSVSNGDRG